MPTTDKDDAFWDAQEPFANQKRPQEKQTRKKKTGTDAEIVLPDLDVDDEVDSDVEVDDDDFEPDYDEFGDPIDGSEDDITALEEQADEVAPVEAAVAADVRARAAVSRAAAKRSATMPEKKTKAELIRDEIARRKAAGETTIRPRDVIAALAEKGVTVTAPQVSVTLKTTGEKTGAAPKAKTIKSAKLADAAAAAEKTDKRATSRLAAPAPASAANRPSYEALEAAAAFARAHGGVDAATRLLDAYSQLLQQSS